MDDKRAGVDRHHGQSRRLQAAEGLAFCPEAQQIYGADAGSEGGWCRNEEDAFGVAVSAIDAADRGLSRASGSRPQSLPEAG